MKKTAEQDTTEEEGGIRQRDTGLPIRENKKTAHVNTQEQTDNLNPIQEPNRQQEEPIRYFAHPQTLVFLAQIRNEMLRNKQTTWANADTLAGPNVF